MRNIGAAGQLESVGVIVPALTTNNQLCLTHKKHEFLVPRVWQVGFLLQTWNNCYFEPLNRNEAFYMRQVADVASICRDINNPGVKCMGDFGTWLLKKPPGAHIA